MDNNTDTDSSKTIKVGDVDITINIDHHDGNDERQPGGGYNAPAYAPPVHKRRVNKNVISIIIICFCVLSVIGAFWSYSSFTPSTHDRRPLAPGAAIETGYYTDEAGWIEDEKVLLKGLREFYKTTVVHPYLYITNTVNGSTSATAEQLNSYTNNLYRELFSDEAHLLVVLFVSGGGYIDSYACGTQAAGVIDAEAENILHDYLNYEFSFSSYTNSKALSEAFSRAADHIMTTTLSPWGALLVCGPTAAIVAYFYFRRRRKGREIREAQIAEQTEEMLKIPLEKFGDPEVEELAKKYEDKN